MQENPLTEKASSRKDVIVRHTRNFHPGVANRTGSGHRGRRRTNSHPGATGPATRGNASTRASPATTTARGDKDHHSEGVNDAAEEHQESPASNGMDGSQSSQENSLDNFLPSHAELFPVCLPESPLSFSAFMEPELVNSNLSDMIDLDILLSNAQEFLGDMPNNNVPELPPSILEPPRPSLDQTNNNTTDHNSVADDNNCASAWANLTKYPVHILASLRFPSKYAVRRFVKAFFKHIAAHIPIVHEPTFDIATAPSPLLLAIMACGAVYPGEYSTAISMHAVSVQLIFEHERTFASKKFDIETLAWMLQTYLLLSYFEIHCGMEGKAAHAFPHSIKLAQEAIGELKRHQITTYRDWVRQESINRCIASTILIGASIGSKEREEWLASPVVDARFALPSSTAEWLKDEAGLEVPTQALYSDDALNSIFAGQEPALPISEFGLVTIVFAILYQACSFEILTSSHHMELYTNFAPHGGSRLWPISGSERALRQVHDELGLLPSYGSIPLTAMKKLLQSPSALDNSEQISTLSDEAASPELYKALLRAADQLRFDCRLGLNYLKKMAPIRFGPECAIGAYEGGMAFPLLFLLTQALFCD
ncbi:Vanillin dehydrogenase [Fusarium albosuccineum]|uniref:Vanillin dehydrogenase n=1 Tax=Fusarium albosuccineum TaxID=1237068 RepID=A0A8H4KEQ3_9HYPO|nr:Vanillin dehydrogenase [Fusarium albosuccineum]